MASVTLGPVVLDGFEVPARLKFGGAQALAIHKLPGGVRVVDSMGRDDGDLAWSGIFSGAAAGDRARLLDAMRAAGDVLPLSWDCFSYAVVIRQLDLEYCGPWWITYRIACTVVADEAQSPVSVVSDLATTVLGDLFSAASFSDVSGALVAVQASGALIVGSQMHTSAVAAIASADESLSAGIAIAETGMAASSINGLLESSQSLAQLCCAQGFVERAGLNLEDASS